MRTRQQTARRGVLRTLLVLALSGLASPRPAVGSPDPWTVDRWAGRPRRVAKPRPDRPQSKRADRPDLAPASISRAGGQGQSTSVSSSLPHEQRAPGGLVEQVHHDPLPGLPVIDHFEGRPLESLTRPEKPVGSVGKKEKGQGSIELLIAAPVLLFAGLIILQVFLLMQARQALRLGALEAGRAASVAYGDPQAALQGLAQGLAPWWIGAGQTHDAVTAPLRTRVHLAQSLAQGRLRITQLAPNEAAFTDWAVPATDDAGGLLAGQREIPNDALRIRSTETQPQTAAAGLSNGQPLGVQSGQTLLQANVLRLQIDYVVALRVPLAGQAIAVLARAWQTDPALRRMSSSQGVPIRVAVAIRMQTPARFVGAGEG